MTYTVKQLAEISGGSVRALHWYDKIGLLKPAYIGANGYRYYEEKQLIILKQILFFREFGFNLSEIQTLLSQNNEKKINTLKSHKDLLAKDIHRKNDLIKNIEEVIFILQSGEKTMSSEEIYNNFKTIHLNNNKLLKSQHLEDLKSKSHKILSELTDIIKEDLEPSSEKAQKIIHQHYHFQNRFYDLSKDGYLNLIKMYNTNLDFKNFFATYHPDLLSFITEAITYYVEHSLEKTF